MIAIDYRNTLRFASVTCSLTPLGDEIVYMYNSGCFLGRFNAYEKFDKPLVLIQPPPSMIDEL
jgi:hypothetical protein